MHSHWSIAVLRSEYANTVGRFTFARTFENYFKAIEHFFRVYILESYANPRRSRGFS